MFKAPTQSVESEKITNAMADSFSLWDEIKAYARQYAVSNRPLPMDAECELWLERMVGGSLRGEPLGREVFDFYARELCAMIRDFRDGMQQSA
jgi:hypothetical protein